MVSEDQNLTIISTQDRQAVTAALEDSTEELIAVDISRLRHVGRFEKVD